MKTFLLRYWPLLAALLIFYSITGWLLLTSLHQNNNHLVYAQDDAYIHMALAKNFVKYGVWGITPYGFTSSVSSLLWPLLLIFAYYSWGVNQVSPLILNLASSGLVLLISYGILRCYKLRAGYILLSLLGMMFFGTLPALTLEGMEHILHIALTLLATFLSARLLAGEAGRHARRDSLLLLAVAPLVTAARFEGMSLIVVIAGLFLLRAAADGSEARPEPGGPVRRWRGLFALGFGICGFLPVAIYSTVSVWHGWNWLPNSVLLKGRFPPLTSARAALVSLVSADVASFTDGPHLIMLLLVALFLYISTFHQKGAWESRQVMTTIFVVTTLLHIQFALVCMICRHDAYLVALGVLVVAAQLAEFLPERQANRFLDRSLFARHIAVGALAVILAFPLALRGVVTLSIFLRGTTNIFQQQYQMGLFIKQFYQGSTVALNDIGAVNFLADVHCLDLWGLANLQVARKKQQSNYHTRDIYEMGKQSGARIAIVYDGWFGGDIGGLPAEWVKVGQWTIQHNVVTSDRTVSIYAVDPAETAPLVQHLRDFSARLPQGVIQGGLYTEWADIFH